MRKIGRSEIRVSPLAMGAWAIGGGTWWGSNDDQVSVKTIHTALDAGINWIDTARVYGFGHSEEIVGKALHDRRERAVLSTKCGLQWYDQGGEFHFSGDGHTVHRDLTPKAIRRDLELSLQTLNTDYIDVYFTHWQCKTEGFVPIEETMQELMKMKQEGKIRAIGASNVNTAHLEEYLKWGELDVIQEKYSILDRRIETELLPFCEKHQLTLQTYSPIEHGLLAGKVPDHYQTRPGEARENKLWWHPENIKAVNAMLRGWEDLTEKYQCSAGNLVIAWTMMRSAAFNVLCGARKVEQIAENAKALKISLEQQDFERMQHQAEAVIAAAVK